MKKLIALIALASISHAEIGDGSVWSGGGIVIAFDISANPTVNTVDVGRVGGTGTVTGVPGPNSSVSNPTAQSFSPLSFDHDGDPETDRAQVRGHNGRAQYLNEQGHWVNMRLRASQTPNNKPPRNDGGEEEVTSLP